jgi:hypothetical protein
MLDSTGLVGYVYVALDKNILIPVYPTKRTIKKFF